MSNGKPPFDPDPDSERTVIRPNPGGRRDGPVAGPSQQQQQVTPAPSTQDIWGGQRQNPGAGQAPQASPNKVQRPPPTADAPNSEPLELNTSATTGGPNPILDCAMPLLILLANVRIAKSLPQVAPLMSTVAQSIEAIEAALHGRNILEAQVRAAKYALCATADDIVQNLPSSDRLIWTQYSMLSRFFQVRDSGIGFFDELAKLKQNPQLNHNVLGLMHACMSLGFEGKYRMTGGDIAHQEIRRDIYQTLRSRETRAPEDISPHWRGQNIAAAYVRRAIPLWAIVACAAGLMFVSFIGLRWMLGNLAGIAEAKLAGLHPQTELNLQRVDFKPYEPPIIPQSTQLERIRERLKDDIAAKRLSADYAGKDIVLRLLNDAVFDKASASVKQSFLPSIEHIGAALNAEKGAIRIVGHTDNTPILSSVKFKDNQDLSEQRAKAVASVLASNVTDPTRLAITGMADRVPVDQANTPEAHAKNRRVEVFILREDL